MRKNLQTKILISLLAASSLGICGFTIPAAAAEDYTVKEDGETFGGEYEAVYGNGHSFTFSGTANYVNGATHKNKEDNVSGGNITINGGTITGDVHGGNSHEGYVNNNYVTISHSKVAGYVIGGFSDLGHANNNHVIISNSEINGTYSSVWGGRSDYGGSSSGASNNHVIIKNSTVKGNIYGGYSGNDDVNNNQIIIAGTSNIENANLYGSNQTDGTGNTLTFNGWSGIVNSINNFDAINFENISINENTEIKVNEVNGLANAVININSIAAGNYEEEKTFNATLTIDEKLTQNSTINIDTNELSGNLDKYHFTDRENNDGLYVNQFDIYFVENNDNEINISGKVKKTILTGIFIDKDGNVHKNTNQTLNYEDDDLGTLTISDGFKSNASILTGVLADDGAQATGGVVNISGKTDWSGKVYAGFSVKGEVNNNIINVAAGTQAQSMDLSGYNSVNQNNADNTLNISGNGSAFNSIERFDAINFDSVNFKEDAALSVTDADVESTTINVNSLAGGQTFKAGDTQTLLSSANAITGSGEIKLANDVVTAGLAQDVKFSAAQSADNKSIDLRVEGVSVNKQIDLVAENRAVAAAFINQGTDLISDSLDVISRDGNYGVKTFAAVQGNRSKYDVNSDLKINGWSTIVGVGSETEHNGGDFSWGVFYENGSGNYRTFNEFNNEFFRGDGSLVYNGGGVAARYENAHGVYTEGSLRAGMLKSEMDNALSDGENKYGYSSESEYYGAHIGVGQIIPLTESSDLDVYGKFFHTYTEGDSFTVANDKFEFDSINSDRLRVGARVTTNKANKFSTYYGLAYEYEFNGDAEMRAQNLAAPTQSLQGSSYMAELGFNYQPTPDSPWNFDLNMRGYAGEREGATFNVQATYTF